MRDHHHRKYNREWLQVDRPQPMYDQSITDFYQTFYVHSPIHQKNLDTQFADAFMVWLSAHTLNQFRGFDAFNRRDITNGCTQFIDDLYMRCGSTNVMIFENDYRYHWRLNNNIKYVTLDTLDPHKELLISMPFPSIGDVYPDMKLILDRCLELRIPVHIDGAWVSCCRDIVFDFDHPAIQTFCISLSKGGMGGNRVGLRFARQTPAGAITIMNDFNMNSQALVSMGIKFMEHFGPEYFWKTYGSYYQRVCHDFGLKPTKTIHLAIDDNNAVVGIRPLLRCLSGI
jgi:hypothetical protein